MMLKNKNFYIMLSDTPWAGPVARSSNPPDTIFDDGVFIDEIPPIYEVKLVIDEQAENKTDFYPCDIHGPSKYIIFSEKLINILNTLDVDNIQYFDANVTYEPTSKQFSYKIANITGVINGLNMDESDVIMSSAGNVIDIEKMVFDEEKMSGHKIFRLAKDRAIHSFFGYANHTPRSILLDVQLTFLG